MSAAVKIAQATATPHLAHLHNPHFTEVVPSKTRPHHSRRRSKPESPNPVSAIRSAFRRVLPKPCANAPSFKTMALDFYAASMGLVSGVCIDNFGLTYLETAMLALELSHAVNTSYVLLLLSDETHQLLVIHTDILASRMDDFPNDATLFAERAGRKIISRPAHDYDHFQAPFAYLRAFLRSSTRQCLQTSEFGWSPIEAGHMMAPLTAWMLEHPVVCFDNIPDDLTPEEEFEPSYQSWRLRVRFEGYEPRYDHSFEFGTVPAALFDEKSADGSAPDTFSEMSAMQDRVQNTMSDRLNGNVAGKIWADVNVEWS